MANPGVAYFTQSCSISFSDFPEDVQLCILSFLSPSDLATFACTSKHFSSLYRADSKLWFALCDRRWGSYTEIMKWGNGHVDFMLLYRTLAEYENLIGFWRRIGDAGISNSIAGSPPPHSQLVFFEWGPSFLTGSTVSPSKDGGYNVIKSPFIWMSMSCDGEAVCYLDPNSRIGLQELPDSPTRDLVHVNVSFMGKGHLFVEECPNFGGRGGNNQLSNSSSPDTRRIGYGFSRSGSIGLMSDDVGGLDMENMGGKGMEIGSPPDRLMSEMYQYFANRTSPGSGGDRAWRRQRKREKERRGRRRWEPEHLVKITGCSPSPTRPLQGLWKGITDDMNLDFFLVSYDEMGGITCRRVGDSSKPFCGGPPVFWTSDATFTASPLPSEEELIYASRLHLRPIETAIEEDESSLLLYGGEEDTEAAAVSMIMYINSSYDLLIPDLAGISVNPRHVEGRIWLYGDGSFGFGFLRNEFIIDLKRIALDGRLVDSTEVVGVSGL